MCKYILLFICIFGPHLMAESIYLDQVRLNVEIADNDEVRKKGLMDRTHLAKNSGMLFIFPTEEIRHFWMKRTFIPLSIAFLNQKFEIIEILKMNPVKSMLQVQDIPKYKSSTPALIAIEVNKGWFRDKGIKIGSRLIIKGKSKSKLLNKNYQKSLRLKSGKGRKIK